MPDPAPKLSNSTVVGISLEANIPKVGAHSSVHSSKPLKTSASMQLSKASTLSNAVFGLLLATQSKKAASHASLHEAITEKYILLLKSSKPFLLI